MEYRVVRHRRRPNATYVDHRWDDGPEVFCVRHSIANPGMVFYQTFLALPGEMNNPDQEGVWFAAPDWVYAAIGEADDMAGVLDWLVERFPDHGRLHDAVRRVAAAGLTAGGVPA